MKVRIKSLVQKVPTEEEKTAVENSCRLK